MQLLRANPYVFEYLDADSVDDIDQLVITAATELEFWVKTPDDDADREQLSTAQMLKEQYWKRTTGTVRTALEEVMLVLQKYGFDMEMGHKEVGGVKANLSNSGSYDHVMEQLEIDWKYSTAVQAADNENQIKYVVRDIFRTYGLDVTFMAKPVEGVAGNGEHTHMGVAAKLKDGSMINLFAPSDPENEFMSPVGFGALMGILKNYDVINPFVSATNDSLNRLKPGYEAPVCTVTSLGHSAKLPSRNRTVLVGLVREVGNQMATRFELRAPNPKSNTYLVLAASYMAMLDGIKEALENGKTPADLEKYLAPVISVVIYAVEVVVRLAARSHEVHSVRYYPVVEFCRPLCSDRFLVRCEGDITHNIVSSEYIELFRIIFERLYIFPYGSRRSAEISASLFFRIFVEHILLASVDPVGIQVEIFFAVIL